MPTIRIPPPVLASHSFPILRLLPPASPVMKWPSATQKRSTSARVTRGHLRFYLALKVLRSHIVPYPVETCGVLEASMSMCVSQDFFGVELIHFID